MKTYLGAIIDTFFRHHPNVVKAIAMALCLVAPVVRGASFRPLGHLPGTLGSTHSTASAVSNDGQVVAGFSSSSQSVNEAFRWTEAGGMVALGDLPGGSFWSTASGVSADGGVVTGYSEIIGPHTHWGGYTWRSDTGMVTMGLPSGANTMFTSGISGDGTTVVGWAIGERSPQPPSYWNGFLWTSAGGYVELGFQPQAISGDGTTIVGDEIGGDHAVFWNPTVGIVLMDHVPGYSGTTGARGVSANGTVIVGSEYDSGGMDYEAFRWTASGGMAGLGHLAGASHSAANAVSADGATVVGKIYKDYYSDLEAIVWTETAGMRRLIDVLRDYGASGLEGWTLVDALDISDDGQWVVGYGNNPAGDEEAFLANLSPPPDSDGDGIADPADNCTLAANSTQLDADADGYGNACDADLNNSGFVTSADFSLLRTVLNQPASSSALAAAADMNGSGLVTSADFSLLRGALNAPPGPSALAP